MREVELKGAPRDPEAARARLEAAGAVRTLEGRLEDRRYDTPDRDLALRDHVLRLRVLRAGEVRASLDLKGPTSYEDGYKVREEESAAVADLEAMARILDTLGYVVSREIDREIVVYQLAGATIRFERYPRMDVLVEVEGDPSAIEGAIVAMGLSRDDFSTGRLPDFVRAFEARTGARAAICDRELDGDYRYAVSDA